jgi:putative PIN family toxin of toxin-antitoxin system
VPNLRVVLDTNVLLSGIAYPASIPGKIMAAWRHGSIEVVLSNFILEELRRVLPRLQSRHGLNKSEINDLVDSLSLLAETVEPEAGLPEAALRDANDQPVLSTLLAARSASGASYLVTGDKDLLVLADRYPVVTPARFWEVHGSL